MGGTGFFAHPKSPVPDNATYTATGAKQINSKEGLHMVDLDFSTPTPPPPAPIPTVAIPPYIPPPAGGCTPYTEINGCTCQAPPYAIWVYCNGKIPMNPSPDCMVGPNGDTTFCDSLIRNNPSCIAYCMGKPVIYLYPLIPTYVNVSIVTPGNIVESIPQIETGNTWQNVLALPGGILKYKNAYYRELYYESSQDKVKAPDNGMFINTQNLKQELKVQTENLGLLPNESDEFVAYWLPRLQQLNKPYIFFSVISKEEKERTDHVEISPKPDVFIEFIAYFKGVDEKFQTKPFAILKPSKRIGFTAVEWGGVIEPN